MKVLAAFVSLLWIQNANGIKMPEYGITRNEKEKRALFRRIVNNRILNKTAIANHINCESSCCARQCLSNPTCQSFYVNNHLQNCSLLDVDRNSKSESDKFVNKEGYAYYDTGFTLTNEVWRRKPLYKIICSKPCGSCPCIHIEEEGDVCDCYSGSGHINLGSLCWKPADGCGSVDGTKILLDDVCNNDPVYDFKFNAETGDLLHVCSNKRVCTIHGRRGNGEPIVLGTCPEVSTKFKWLLMFGKYLYYGDRCIHPLNGWLTAGNSLLHHTGCGAVNSMHTLEHHVPGRVKTEIWYDVNSFEGLKNDPRFPNSPDSVLWHHNLDLPNYGTSFEKFGRRLRTKFTSPETGAHTFHIACDDVCELFFGSDENTKNSIIYKPTSNGMYDYRLSSPPQKLQSDQPYFIEVLFYENARGDHLAVAVTFPSSKEAYPITERYLTAP